VPTDANLFKPTLGRLWYAAVGATTPATDAAFFGATVTGFTSGPHRDAANAFGFGRENSTTSVLRTYEAPAARTATTAGTRYVDLTVAEWATEFQSWYEGKAVNGTTVGVFDGAAVEKNMIFIFVDGATEWALHVPRMGLNGNGDLVAPDPDGEDWFGIPIRATQLTPASGYPFRWIKKP
jgi:hypothetical protein